jgi:hypothetical protein
MENQLQNNMTGEKNLPEAMKCVQNLADKLKIKRNFRLKK